LDQHTSSRSRKQKVAFKKQEVAFRRQEEEAREQNFGGRSRGLDTGDAGIIKQNKPECFPISKNCPWNPANPNGHARMGISIK
jgi:hypothetical protein